MFSWASNPNFSLDKTTFVSFIAGYFEGGGKLTEPTPLLIASRIGAELRWLEFCLRQSLGEDIAHTEPSEARAEVTRIFGRLDALETHREQFAAWIEQARRSR